MNDGNLKTAEKWLLTIVVVGFHADRRVLRRTRRSRSLSDGDVRPRHHRGAMKMEWFLILTVGVPLALFVIGAISN